MSDGNPTWWRIVSEIDIVTSQWRIQDSPDEGRDALIYHLEMFDQVLN